MAEHAYAGPETLPSDQADQRAPVLPRIPLATYRLQFNRHFTFAGAARVISYLSALGISDCYASPYFKAAPGSLHGYDVIDQRALNPEVGSEKEYETFVQELRRHGMGQLLDIVPNHMGIAESKNPWWLDVLENGPSSVYASFFDIDWAPIKTELANKVLLPILGDQYGRVLENQELTLVYEDGAFFVRYYAHQLPIAPRPTTMILSHRLEDLERTLGPANPYFLKLQSIVTALDHLPLRTETNRDKVIERSREKEIIKQRLAALMTESPEVHSFVTENVRLCSGVKGDPHSFDLLDRILDDQAYRLAYWRVAAEEINYRRFFDINDLAAVRTEDPMVFATMHQLVLQLLAEGKVTGLRIDHIDGLYDPAGYLRRLQHAARLVLEAGSRPEHRSTPVQAETLTTQLLTEPAAVSSALTCYVVAEKILDREEPLPEQWSAHGTTGYDFLPVLNGIFVDQTNARRFTDLYARFTRTRLSFSDIVYETKQLIMQTSLSSETNVLAHHLNRLSEQDRHARDFTLNSLTHAIRETIACFPVYRTYIDEQGVSERDRMLIETAIARAKRRNPATDVSVFNYLRDVLLLRFPDAASEDTCRAHCSFVMKFQQCTGPVMAKGIEDTAFYRYNRLVSLNEVGGTPEQFGTSLAAFHVHNRKRLERWPHTLLATTTHDTKRSEDVRARINVLSEIPQEWQAALRRWHKLNRKKKSRMEGQPVPDRNEEYLLYQTLLGAWPLLPMNGEEYGVFKQRIGDYMRKATKEAKVNTSWINPNHAYDEALQAFVRTVLDDQAFLTDFQAVLYPVAQYGMYNSLSQTLLKLTAPGVPDVYQGNEIWDFSLVDPDNRRAVDYEQRRRMLEILQQHISTAGQDLTQLVQELLASRTDGRIKLYLTHQVLTYRRAHPALFLSGTYVPLDSRGPKHTHLCAFARQHEGCTIVVVVPRLLAGLLHDPERAPLGPQVWEDTWLTLPEIQPNRAYRNVLTGQMVPPAEREGRPALGVGDVLAQFPVALVEHIEPL